jgi:hypothetical protein
VIESIRIEKEEHTMSTVTTNRVVKTARAIYIVSHFASSFSFLSFSSAAGVRAVDVG